MSEERAAEDGYRLEATVGEVEREIAKIYIDHAMDKLSNEQRESMAREIASYILKETRSPAASSLAKSAVFAAIESMVSKEIAAKSEEIGNRIRLEVASRWESEVVQVVAKKLRDAVAEVARRIGHGGAA